jgi:curved DNA-binding protein CbpA
MGAAVSRIEPNHVAIYKKVLMIREATTRAQTLQTLMSGPEYVNSARVVGIYPQLLQYIAAVNGGRNPGPLPGEGPAPVSAPAPAPASASALAQNHTASIQEEQYRQIQYQSRPQQQQTRSNQQITSYNESGGFSKLYKPRSTEKALNFFQSCLQILGIEESASLSEDLLKKAYKRAAIKSHPDKGGSEQEFEAVTRAYAYLVEVVKRVSGSGSAQGQLKTVDEVHAHRRETAYTHDAPPTALNPNNLNMSVFNKVFEDNRMPEPDEDGYGDWLKDEAEQTGPRAKFGGKFNRDVFNKVFEEDARSQAKSQALIHYNDPQEIVPVAGVELGRDRPSDYTAPFNADGLQYTDLKNAYTRENTFSSKVANVKVADRTYERVVTERKSAPATYSDAERALMEQAQRQREAQERQRQVRAAEEGMAAQRYAEQLKRRLLVNGSTVEGHKAISDR